MKNEAVTKNKNRGFTIVELLTVMAVILILMSLLVPALNQLRIHAYYVKQKNQFRGIDVAIEFYNTDREGYPDSGDFDRNPLAPPVGMASCGAIKLAEAMVGQDLLGFIHLYDQLTAHHRNTLVQLLEAHHRSSIIRCLRALNRQVLCLSC